MYDVVLADPSWEYKNKRTGGSHTSGAAQKYDVMTPAIIAALPVPCIMERSSVCFLWATVPMGRDPYDVLGYWGYTFKTEWFWHKVGRKGTGYWTRGCVEKVLVGVKGNVKAWRSNIDNWFDAEDPEPGLTTALPPEMVFEETPSRVHSRKPAIVRETIEALTPGLRRVELFATEIVPGWDSFGLALDPSHNFLLPQFWERLDVGRPQGQAAAVPEDEAPHPTIADA